MVAFSCLLVHKEAGKHKNKEDSSPLFEVSLPISKALNVQFVSFLIGNKAAANR